MNSNDKWDRRFVAVAMMVATWSKDPDKQVGAVIVSPSTRQLSTGYNGFVTGANDTLGRYENMSADTKNSHTIHAELNAILNARTNVQGWTLYCTKFPCHQCALAIIQAGVTRLVAPDIDYGKWTTTQLDAKVELGIAKVDIETYELEGV